MPHPAAGLTAAITAAEAGAKVTVHEAHHTLGGRARTAAGGMRYAPMHGLLAR